MLLLLVQAQDAANAARQEGAFAWYERPDWWVAIGTGVLALVTAALAVYTYRLFREARLARADSVHALGVAEKSAAAATRSADVAKESMQRQLRAYVTVDRITTDKVDDKMIPTVVSVRLINSGQTPSLRQYCFCKLTLEKTFSAELGPLDKPDRKR